MNALEFASYSRAGSVFSCKRSRQKKYFKNDDKTTGDTDAALSELS